MKGSKGTQFPGRRITMGEPNYCGGAEKPEQCRKYFLQQHICFRKTVGSNMGTPNLFIAQGAV